VDFVNKSNFNKFNIHSAQSGDRSYHMIDQAHLLYQRFISNQFCDWKNDWKVITFFIGVTFQFKKKNKHFIFFCLGK